jgi:hypothetical protein
VDDELLIFWIDQLKELLPDPCDDEIELETSSGPQDPHR